MKTITLTVYKFSELSDKAKQRAKDKHAELFGYSWGDEAIESLKALAVHFDGKVQNYSIDWFDNAPSQIRFDMPEMMTGEIEKRLENLGSYNPETLRGLGDCKLTGCCSDEDAIDGFRKAFHGGERNLDELMKEAGKSWLKAAQADCAAGYEDENFSETSDANDWQYYDDGRIAPKQ